MTNKIDLCEHTRIRLIAAAIGHQQCTKTAACIVTVPGGDRVIAIGTPTEIAKLLPELRAAVLVEARDACEQVQGVCQERDAHKWPELRDDAAGGAGDCVAAIEALRAEADSEGGHHD